MKLKKKTIIITASIVAFIIIIALTFFFVVPAFTKKGAISNTKVANSINSTDTTGYTIVKVSALETGSGVESSGNLEPYNSVDLSFQKSGTVKAVYVKEGAYVAKGTLLAILNDAQERYKIADSEYRIQQNQISGSIRQAELLAMENELLKIDLEQTRLTAPFSGVLSTFDIQESQYNQANKTIGTLIDKSALIAIMEIDEIDLPKVKLGSKVQFTIDALPGVVAKGIVSRIPDQGRITSQGIAVFDVEALIKNPAKELLPGYSFAATISNEQADAILILNAEAVTTRNNKSSVMYVNPETGKPERRSVEIKQRTDGTVQILSGISEGDSVAIIKRTTTQTSTSANPLQMLIPGGQTRQQGGEFQGPPPDMNTQGGAPSGGATSGSAPTGGTSQGGPN